MRRGTAVLTEALSELGYLKRLGYVKGRNEVKDHLFILAVLSDMVPPLVWRQGQLLF